MKVTPVDRALVAATFAELGDKRATARKLGIHENSVRLVLRGLAERCTRCGGAKKNGETYCATCRSWSRDRMRERRKERSRLGLCGECDEPRSPLSRQHCAHHRQQAIDRQRRFDERKAGERRGRPAGKSEQHLRAILSRYGEHAVAAWHEAGGCCELCQTPPDQSSVQVHHIDENPKNGARGNLAILCFDCHQATHRLLALRERAAFLAWFERTYPL